MTIPIHVIAQAIRTADGRHDMGAAAIAEVVAENLTRPEIVANAVHSLLHDGWRTTPEGPRGEYRFTDDELRDIARTVLASVGEHYDRPQED